MLQVPATLPDGTYTARAHFAGLITMPGGQTVQVDDEVYNPSTATAILIVDNQSPTPVPPASVTPSILSPPNHKLVNVTVTARFTDANFGYARIISVTSDEPDNGLGDGDTPGDVVFSSDPVFPTPPVPTSGPITVNLTLQLRSERAENNRFGPGRTYTITVQGFDLAGNPSSIVTLTVFVSQ